MADNATAKDVVDLAMDDKPNAAGEALNDILLNKVGEKVSAMKDQISNDMFGQEMPEPVEDEEEDVEVQPELDLEPEEDDGEEYEADQEYIEEPVEDESEEEIEPEESEEEEEE
mgnify:CR=1 FL=1